MKPAGMFVSALLIVDTFLVSYYIGFHSRTVSVVDPNLKPVEKPVSKPVSKAPPDGSQSSAGGAKPNVPHAKDKHASKSEKPLKAKSDHKQATERQPQKTSVEGKSGKKPATAHDPAGSSRKSPQKSGIPGK